MVFVKYCVKFYTVIFYTCLGASGWALLCTVFDCRVNYEHVECLSIVFSREKQPSGCPRSVRVLYGVQKKLRFLLNMVRGVRRILAMTPWMMINNSYIDEHYAVDISALIHTLEVKPDVCDVSCDLLPNGWVCDTPSTDIGTLSILFPNTDETNNNVFENDAFRHGRDGHCGSLEYGLNAFDWGNDAKHRGDRDVWQHALEYCLSHKVRFTNPNCYKNRGEI